MLDNRYKVAKRIQSTNGRPPLDLHELKLEGGTKASNTALLTIYEPMQYDYKAPGKDPQRLWVTAGIFQEVNVDTGALVFEWNSLDHVDPCMSTVPLKSSDMSGDGQSAATAWDYL